MPDPTQQPKETPSVSLAFPLDQNTRYALKKGGFILSGAVTLSSGAATIYDHRIHGSSVPLVSLASGGGGSRGGGSYVGHVAFGGSAGTPFPSGWSVAHTSTGVYTITHDLGDTDYEVAITCYDGYLRFIEYDKASSTVTVRLFNISGSAADAEFGFLVATSASGGASLSASCTDGQLTISGSGSDEVAYLVIL
jgi:hypothetical protein